MEVSLWYGVKLLRHLNEIEPSFLVLVPPVLSL